MDQQNNLKFPKRNYSRQHYPSSVIDVEDTEEMYSFAKPVIKKPLKNINNNIHNSCSHPLMKTDDIPLKYKLFVAFGALIEDSKQYSRLLSVPFFVYVALYIIDMFRQ